jgi:hypothetical protein
MLELHQTMTIPQDHILRLRVPHVPKGKEVEVIVLSKEGPRGMDEKLALIARAAKDPLYLSDMQELTDDFAAIDSEHI